MMQFFRSIKSDGYKVIHSPLILIHLFIPILGVAAFLAYYAVSPWEEAEKVLAYLQVLSVAFPLLIGVVMAIAWEMEQQAGAFQVLLCTPDRKYVPHLGKLTVLLMFGLISTFIAVLGFGVIFQIMGNGFLPTSLYLKATILLFLGNLPLYMLQYILTFAFGKGVGLSFGIMGSLLSALLLTGLGDGIWPILPWSIATRFCGILVGSEVTNSSFANNTGVRQGFVSLIISSMILLLLLKLWGEKWEGGKNEMD